METLAYAPQHGAPRDEPDTASVPDPSPRRSHWRVWISLGVALVVLRLGCSIVLAPALAARLSRVLGARVDIGDVSVAPLDAIITLRRVTVHAPATANGMAGGPPAVVADRVRLDVQWLPLLHRAVLVRELVLESAHMDLRRSTAGTAGLDMFLRADPASELPPGWTFALDRIVLRDTALRLREVVDGDPAGLEVKLREAQVSTLPRRVTAFGRAPNLRIDAAVDGGRIRVDGSSDLRDGGVMLDARIRAKDLPLAPFQSYLHDLGWSGLRGRLSARLHYRRDPTRRDLLTGRLLARGIEVRVPALAEPALAIRRAVADVEGINLRARRVAIESLTLHGVVLAASPDFTAPIPLLAGMRVSPDAVRPRTLATEGDGAPPWRWTIARVAAPSGRVRFAGREGLVVIAANLSAENLGPAAYWSPLRAWFRAGDGAAAFDGTARMTRGLAIDGRLTAGAIDVPAFARAVGLPWADLVQSGRGAADLNLEVVPGAVDGSAADVRGRVSLTGLSIAGPDPTAFALAADTMEIELASFPASADDAPGRRSVRISDASVGAPHVQLTRMREGWVLPPFADDASPPAVPAAAAVERPDESSPDLHLVFDQLRTNGGRVTIVDAGASPSVTLDLAVREGWGRDVRLPDMTLGDFMIAGTERRLGPLRLEGTGAEGGPFELSGESVPLDAAAPFLERAGLPYRLEGGTASFLSRIAITDARWIADTTLTMREARVAGDTARLREVLGKSVESALAELRDPNGDVTLQLALAAPGPGDRRTLSDTVAAAMSDAVAGAVPFRIAFVPGRAEPTAAGVRQIAALAEILQARPNLVVELDAAVSTDDRRWLAEQALAKDLEPAGRLKGVLRTFGIRGRDERIREALEERAAGRPSRLDADDAATLEDRLARRAPVDASRLATLAAARVAGVAAELADEHGIAPARVLVAAVRSDDGAAPPAVRARTKVSPRIARLSAPDVGTPTTEVAADGAW